MTDNKKLLKQEKKNLKMNESYQALEEKETKKNKKRELKAREKEIKEAEREEKAILKAPIKAENRRKNEAPQRPLLEEIGNSVTHGVGAIWAIVALILMLLKSDTGLKITASIVYGLCMILMMLMSCLYHAFRSGSRVKRIWRRFDYSSIYLLIGGTFAPLFLVYWGDTLGIVLFIVQWVLIVTGITFVCVFGPGRIRWLHYTLYFAIGWSGVMFLPDFINNNLPLLWMILGGGLVYTIGMIPFALRTVKSAHFIWHFFVLAGAIVQYFGILFFVY